MKKIGNYEYSKTHGQITAAGFAAGLIYGLIGRKGIPASLILGVAGGLLGFGAATLLDRPIRVTEPKKPADTSNFKNNQDGSKTPKCNCNAWDPKPYGTSFSPGVKNANGLCIKTECLDG